MFACDYSSGSPEGQLRREVRKAQPGATIRAKVTNGRLYRGPYTRLENLVFTSQGDINDILPLLPILADHAF